MWNVSAAQRLDRSLISIIHLHILLEYMKGVSLLSHALNNYISVRAEVIREVTHGLLQKTPCSHILPLLLELPGKTHLL